MHVKRNCSIVVDEIPKCMDWSVHINSPPDLVIETDASHYSVWGCNKVRTGGLWFQNERLLHTSCLELLAGAFAVKCFTKNWICLQVRLRMGNTIAIACKNKPGRDPLLSIVQSSCRSWELYTREGHASRFRTFSREMEYPSRSGVETPTNWVQIG